MFVHVDVIFVEAVTCCIPSRSKVSSRLSSQRTWTAYFLCPLAHPIFSLMLCQCFIAENTRHRTLHSWHVLYLFPNKVSFILKRLYTRVLYLLFIYTSDLLPILVNHVSHSIVLSTSHVQLSLEESNFLLVCKLLFRSSRKYQQKASAFRKT